MPSFFLFGKKRRKTIKKARKPPAQLLKMCRKYRIKTTKKVGIKSSVGEEFLTADKGKKFRGDGMKKMRKFAEGGLEDGAYDGLKEAAMRGGMARKSPKLPSEDIERQDENPVTKKVKDAVKGVGKYVMGMPGVVGAGVRGMKAGGALKETDAESNPGLAKLPTEVRNKMGYMKKGGMAHSDIKKDMPMMKKVADKAVNGHEKKMHGMAKGGVTRADGCVSKGHTKGKMITMKSGGAC